MELTKFPSWITNPELQMVSMVGTGSNRPFQQTQLKMRSTMGFCNTKDS